jgi:hypothetical protein
MIVRCDDLSGFVVEVHYGHKSFGEWILGLVPDDTSDRSRGCLPLNYKDGNKKQ